MHVYIYIYTFSNASWALASPSTQPSEDMPLEWKHAALDQLKSFLKEEQRRGNFHPHIGLEF